MCEFFKIIIFISKGGAGGPTVNVNTEAQLISAVTDNNPRIVRITSMITLTTRVRVGANKSIVGAVPNAGELITLKVRLVIENAACHCVDYDVPAFSCVTMN